MRATLHQLSPNTYSGEWLRKRAGKRRSDSRSIARNGPALHTLSTGLPTGPATNIATPLRAPAGAGFRAEEPDAMSEPGYSLRGRTPYLPIHKRPKLVLPDKARVAVWTIVNVENW